ncbi:unnamed protein product [Mytilus edulis]|uniref:Uncharacterized protein n=1 Tax=Mytilus edulis TaxID=6550 RepID=A0A8S3VQ29_MYTED|nr:unnamed protein product [Mytilus edulis]
MLKEEAANTGLFNESGNQISLQVDRRERRYLLGRISDHGESDTQSVSSHYLDKQTTILRKLTWKCAATDAGINNLNDIQAKVLYLRLSDDGVFRRGLEKEREKRKEQRGQLEDVLPEFHKTNKRKLDYDILTNKQTKFAENSTYQILRSEVF